MKNKTEIKDELKKRCQKHKKISNYSERRRNQTFIKALLWVIGDPRADENNLEIVMEYYAK